ncbi:hypothetical protein ACFT8P_28260 [Streptomyces sp. NPDC057101]|uniref:hypothetical protein n=1 Tax=Streptomyces sp. NPDC057101 TaxID=3346020 RepID=UPI003645E2ED
MIDSLATALNDIPAFEQVPVVLGEFLVQGTGWSRDLPDAWGPDGTTPAAHAVHALAGTDLGASISQNVQGMLMAVAAGDQETVAYARDFLTGDVVNVFLRELFDSMLTSAVDRHRQSTRTLAHQQETRDQQRELDARNIRRLRALRQQPCVIAVIEYAAAVQVFVGRGDSLDDLPPAAPVLAHAYLTTESGRPITVRGLDPAYQEIVGTQLRELVARGSGRKNVLFDGADREDPLPAQPKRRPTAKVRFAEDRTSAEELEAFWSGLRARNGELVELASKELPFRVFRNQYGQKGVYLDPRPVPGHLESFGFVVIGSGALEKVRRRGIRGGWKVFVSNVAGIGPDELRRLIRLQVTDLELRLVAELNTRPSRSTYVPPAEEAAPADAPVAAAQAPMVSDEVGRESEAGTMLFNEVPGEPVAERAASTGLHNLEAKTRDWTRTSVIGLFPEETRPDASDAERLETQAFKARIAEASDRAAQGGPRRHGRPAGTGIDEG